MNSKSKNDIFYIIVLILTLITMILGITFTYYSLVAKEKDDNTQIKTGTLYISYIDGDTVSINSLMPMNEPNLNTTGAVYKKNFSVRSTGSLDQTLDIYMNIEQNDFNNNILGYILYDRKGNELAKGSIPKTGKILLKSDFYLKSNDENKFTILIWLKENNQNQNYEMGNIFKAGFDITANQIKYQ